MAILSTDGFELSELTVPRDELKKAGADVAVVSNKAGRIQGFQHHEKADLVAVDVVLSDTRPENYDGLILPGVKGRWPVPAGATIDNCLVTPARTRL